MPGTENRPGLMRVDGFGDQRAKSLIDKNEGEMDARRAIRRYLRALRYGKTSIQASKAFQGLGRRHEDLGNTRLAIHYYTLAIRLDVDLDIIPLPALYWRGRLHYEGGDIESARRDLDWAVQLDDEPTFFPDERDFAKRVLTGQELFDAGPVEKGEA